MDHDEMIWNDEMAYTEAVEAAVIERKRPFKQSVWPEDIPKDTSTEDNLGMREGGERLTKVWTLDQLKHLQIKSATTYFLFY